MSYGPLGDSLAAAVIIAVAFAFPGVWTIGMWLRSKHFLYSAVALAALARVGGMAIRAASISNDGANKAMMISYFMCNQAGFSIMLDMQCITIANWFKNTDTHLAPPLSKLWMKIALFCGPLAICTGLGLGVPSAVLMYGVQSDDAWDKAFILRKVIATGMTAIACVCAMLSLGGWLWTVYHRTQFKPINRVHQKIWVMFASGLFLVWSGGVRINIAFYDKNMATSREQRWYPAQEIPELLQLVAWCWPWLIVEAHYSSKTAEYWENVRSGSSKPGEITTHTAFEDGVKSQPSTSSSGSHLDNVSLGQVVDVQGLSKARSKDTGTLGIIQVAPAALAKQAQAAVGQHHSFAGMSESVTSSVEDESGVALTGNATGKAGHH